MKNHKLCLIPNPDKEPFVVKLFDLIEFNYKPKTSREFFLIEYLESSNINKPFISYEINPYIKLLHNLDMIKITDLYGMSVYQSTNTFNNIIYYMN